jgi:hypothetical protein
MHNNQEKDSELYYEIDEESIQHMRKKYRKTHYLTLAYKTSLFVLRTSPIWVLPIALFLLHSGFFIAGGIALAIPVAFTLFVAVTSIQKGLSNLSAPSEKNDVLKDNPSHNLSIALQNKKFAKKELPYFAVTTVINSATSLFFFFDLAMVTPALVFAVPAAISLVLTMVFVCKYCKAKMDETKYQKLLKKQENTLTRD